MLISISTGLRRPSHFSVSVGYLPHFASALLYIFKLHCIAPAQKHDWVLVLLFRQELAAISQFDHLQEVLV